MNNQNRTTRCRTNCLLIMVKLRERSTTCSNRNGTIGVNGQFMVFRQTFKSRPITPATKEYMIRLKRSKVDLYILHLNDLTVRADNIFTGKYEIYVTAF